ncbi:MAG: hypothetical protein QME90_18005, partial [Thermodesulfobacteriota bacterium]|nr:hypothetical protein [Thermodesulfobacteriota bacterium]
SSSALLGKKEAIACASLSVSSKNLEIDSEEVPETLSRPLKIDFLREASRNRRARNPATVKREMIRPARSNDVFVLSVIKILSHLIKRKANDHRRCLPPSLTFFRKVLISKLNFEIFSARFQVLINQVINQVINQLTSSYTFIKLQD